MTQVFPQTSILLSLSVSSESKADVSPEAVTVYEHPPWKEQVNPEEDPVIESGFASNCTTDA